MPVLRRVRKTKNRLDTEAEAKYEGHSKIQVQLSGSMRVTTLLQAKQELEPLTEVNSAHPTKLNITWQGLML